MKSLAQILFTRFVVIVRSQFIKESQGTNEESGMTAAWFKNRSFRDWHIDYPRTESAYDVVDEPYGRAMGSESFAGCLVDERAFIDMSERLGGHQFERSEATDALRNGRECFLPIFGDVKRLSVVALVVRSKARKNRVEIFEVESTESFDSLIWRVLAASSQKGLRSAIQPWSGNRDSRLMTTIPTRQRVH